MNNALFTIEQVDNKLIITVEAVKVETVEPEQVDLSKYKPFPEGYTIPNNTKVIAIEDSRCCDHSDYSKGKLGDVKKHYKYDEKYVCVVFNDRPIEILMYPHELAPLNPSDHPDYKPEEPEQRPMNAEAIAEWVYDYAGISILHKEPLARYINDAIQYELNKAKR